MKRKMIVSLVVAAVFAMPALASAATTAQVTAYVKKGFTKQIRARVDLAGLKFIGTTVKCAAIGHNRWTCYGTYTLEDKGEYAKYGDYISVSSSGWKTLSNGSSAQDLVTTAAVLG